MSGRGLGEARGLRLGLALGLSLGLGLGVVADSGPGNAAGAGGVGGVGGVGGRRAGEAGPDAPCEALRAALEQALRQALAAESALLSRTRRELCPDLETLAEAPAVVTPVVPGVAAASQAPGPEATEPTAPAGTSKAVEPAGASNAAGGNGASKTAAAAGAAKAPALDFGALRACRQEAERQVQSRWPLLYTDQARFRYFTPAGAALAREADGLRQRHAATGCQLSSQPGLRIKESVHRTGCHQHLFAAGIERADQQVGAAKHGAGR